MEVEPPARDVAFPITAARLMAFQGSRFVWSSVACPLVADACRELPRRQCEAPRHRIAKAGAKKQVAAAGAIASSQIRGPAAHWPNVLLLGPLRQPSHHTGSTFASFACALLVRCCCLLRAACCDSARYLPCPPPAPAHCTTRIHSILHVLFRISLLPLHPLYSFW